MGLDYTVIHLGGDPMYGSEIELTGIAVNGEIDASMNITTGPLTLAINDTWVYDPGLDNSLDRQYFTSSVTGLPICVTTAQVSLGLQLQAFDFGAAATEHMDIYFVHSIPEPSTYALLLLGSAGVGLMVRRKRS
jgi:hypothetical protein